MESTSRHRRTIVVARWAALGLGLLSLAAYVAISLVTADILTRPSNHPHAIDALAISPDATPWSAQTSDGITLRGWYFPTPERRHLIVLVHGMGTCWDEMAGPGRDLHQQGYDVLLFDLRGHGQSDPSRLSMGMRERADLRAVLAWARQQGFQPDQIGWLGYSMGASTVLMEAAQNRDIRVAVVDSPYGNLPELLNTQLTRHSHLPSWFNPGILVAAQLAYGVRAGDLIPIRSARRWGSRPLLLIHGENDTIVPVKQARALAQAAGPSCRALTLPGVEHVEAYQHNPHGYVSNVDRFFSNNLRP
ncbi:MAG TPA: alpha/beta fold hydrolase [Isosphaeraceae bacterium]|jgi:pimeloyl-ACP methyl ester carboxylesterase|nr:alpha/beta fold hydrolase [Isosphaeraceae bacterium]